MSETEIGVDTADLFDQAMSMDENSRDAVMAILVEDFVEFYDDRGEPVPYLLQQSYDTVSNEARIVRDDRSEEFGLVEGFDRESTLSEEIARGDLRFDEVLDMGGMEDVDVSERRLPWAGKKLRKRLAAACREEICEIPDVFALDEDDLRGILVPIILAVIVGTGGAAVLVPIAVLVALFVIQVGINVYCKEYDLGEADQETTL